MLALGEDDGWAEWPIRCRNDRQKGNGKGGLAFVISHPSRKVRGEDGAPSLVVGLRESKGQGRAPTESQVSKARAGAPAVVMHSDLLRQAAQ